MAMWHLCMNARNHVVSELSVLGKNHGSDSPTAFSGLSLVQDGEKDVHELYSSSRSKNVRFRFQAPAKPLILDVSRRAPTQ